MKSKEDQKTKSKYFEEHKSTNSKYCKIDSLDFISDKNTENDNFSIEVITSANLLMIVLGFFNKVVDEEYFKSIVKGLKPIENINIAYNNYLIWKDNNSTDTQTLTLRILKNPSKKKTSKEGSSKLIKKKSTKDKKKKKYNLTDE